jgi:hypothetical protein
VLEQSVSARNSECLAKKDKNRSKCSLFLRKNTVISAISPKKHKTVEHLIYLTRRSSKPVIPIPFLIFGG